MKQNEDILRRILTAKMLNKKKILNFGGTATN